jgi:hypothetical protein
VYSDILLDILSDILSGIQSGFLSGMWSRRGPQHPELAYHPELVIWPRPSPDRWGTTGKSSLQYLQWLSQQAWALKPQTLVKTNHVKVVESAACFGERAGLG